MLAWHKRLVYRCNIHASRIVGTELPLILICFKFLSTSFAACIAKNYKRVCICASFAKTMNARASQRNERSHPSFLRHHYSQHTHHRMFGSDTKYPRNRQVTSPLLHLIEYPAPPPPDGLAPQEVQHSRVTL